MSTEELEHQPEKLILDELKRKVSSIESRLSDMDSIKIPIEILPDGQEPYHANESDAGYDLFATETIYLPPGRSYIMPVGIKVAVPEGYEIQIRPRSGISSKVSLRIANSPGTVDSGYRNEVGVILYNDYGPASTKIHQRNVGPVDIAGNTYHFTELDDVDPESLNKDTIVVKRGDRIAQMVIAKVVKASFVRVDDVKRIGTDRKGGFGSTGVFSMPANNWDDSNEINSSPQPLNESTGPIGFISSFFNGNK